MAGLVKGSYEVVNKAKSEDSPTATEPGPEAPLEEDADIASEDDADSTEGVERAGSRLKSKHSKRHK